MENDYSEENAKRIRDVLTGKGYDFCFNEKIGIFRFFVDPGGLLEHL